MKNLKNLILLFSITLFLTSCASDDSNAIQVDTKDIIGTWNLTEFTIDGKTSTVISGIDIVALKFTTVGKNFDAQIAFTENPNQTTATGSFTAVTTTTVLSQETVKKEEVDLDDLLSTGSWELSEGNILTLNNSTKGEQTIEIVAISSSTLKLTSTIKQEITLEGTITKTTTITNLTLTK